MPDKKQIQLSLILIFWMKYLLVMSHTNEGIRFVQNRGQWPEEIHFRAKIPGGDLFILKDRLRYSFYNNMYAHHEGVFEKHNAAREKQSIRNGHAIDLIFEGSSQRSTVVGHGKYKTVTNFIKGNDQSKWVHGIESYARIEINNLYEGIDFIM